jgi:RNA polymerase sigma factor (sigma-70 family)
MDDPRQLLLDEWKKVERVIAFTCRRYRLEGADAEDFASTVKVKLFEDDCAIVRQFRHGCDLGTYLNVIVQRTFVDLCVRRGGKWHSSAIAKRLGKIAVELERIVYRDGCSPDAAFARIQAAYEEVSHAELDALLAQIPPRQRRLPPVPLETVAESLSAAEEADVLVITRERREMSDRAASAIRGYLQTLEDQHRLILQLHFEADLQLSQVAKLLNIEQKPLYRLRQRLLRELRTALEAAGITAADAADLTGHISDESDFGLRNTELRPSGSEGGVVIPEESPR